MVINLTYAEIQHLLKLLRWDQESGDFSGDRGHYYARTKQLIVKLTHKEDEYR